MSSGDYVNSMLGKCKNGKWFDRIGEKGNKDDVYAYNSNGLNKLDIYSGDWMDGLKIHDSNDNVTKGGKFPEASKHTLDCGTDKLKGIYGTFKTNYN